MENSGNKQTTSLSGETAHCQRKVQVHQIALRKPTLQGNSSPQTCTKKKGGTKMLQLLSLRSVDLYFIYIFLYFSNFLWQQIITFIIGKLFEGKKKRRKKNVHDFFLQRLTGNQIPLTPKTPTFE